MSRSKSSSSPLVAMTIIALAVIFALSLFLGGVYLKNRRNAPSSPDSISLPENENAALAEGPMPEPPPREPTATPVVQIFPTITAVVAAEITAVTPATLVPAAPPSVVAAAEKIVFSSYTVQAGDTLYGISDSFHWLTTIALMAKYDIASGDLIVGSTLSIPVGNTAYCPGSRPYVINDGETAASIAAVVGTTAEQLKQLNGLSDPYTLYVTDVICVP